MTKRYESGRRERPWRLPLALLLGGLALLPGCKLKIGGDNTAQAAAEPEEELAVPVELATLERGPIEATLRLSANLEAERQVKVNAQASRHVRSILVEEGDAVTAGQVLLRLEDDEQRSLLAKTRSQFERAERELARQRDLYAKQLVSEQAFSDATYEYDQRRIALEDARREVGYTEVRAPIAGTITGRHVNVGDQVTVGQHLFDLVDFDSLVAPIYVPERELARLRPGQQARVESQSLAGRTQSGFVHRISPIVDPRSGTVEVMIGLKQRDGLRPGMYVDVELVLARIEDSLLVPKRAIVYDQEQGYVYRLTQDWHVERVGLEPQLADDDWVRPRGELLQPGEQVVVAGQAGLKDGSKVRLAEQGQTGVASEPQPEAGDGA